MPKYIRLYVRIAILSVINEPSYSVYKGFIEIVSYVARYIGVPKGIRTPVAAVKGQCPRPLDDGDIQKA